MLRGIDAADVGRCLPRKGETARGAVCPNIGCSDSVLGHRACSSEARKDCVRLSFGEEGGEHRGAGERLWRWSQRRGFAGIGDWESRLIEEEEGVSSDGSSGIRLDVGEGGT
jgi:hypothetical protein